MRIGEIEKTCGQTLTHSEARGAQVAQHVDQAVTFRIEIGCGVQMRQRVHIRCDEFTAAGAEQFFKFEQKALHAIGGKQHRARVGVVQHQQVEHWQPLGPRHVA